MTPEERAEARWPDDIKATHLMPYSDCSANQIAKRVGCICCIREQVEPLEAWKESAIKVLGEWDKVHEALGKPGKLGESMAAASLAEVQKLRALVQVLFDALANMKIDIYGPLTTELKAAVIALNAAKEEGFVPTTEK